MKNVGKRFEENFKKSISDEYLLYRLKDSPQAFTQSNLTFLRIKILVIIFYLMVKEVFFIVLN